MKYTVITGASSGIGYEAALAFAGKNKNLIIVARSKEKLEQLEKEIKKISPDSDVIIKVSDLSVSENVYKLYDDLKKYTLETWVNNAGFGNTGLVKDQNLEKIETMLHLNIEALTILSTLFSKAFCKEIRELTCILLKFPKYASSKNLRLSRISKLPYRKI